MKKETNEVKKINKVLEKQLELITPSEEEFNKIKKISIEIQNELKLKLKKKKIKADIFIGGSLAKNTIVKKDVYDIDIFVRFDKSYNKNKLSELLEKVFSKTEKIKKIHGSRDYYQIKRKGIITEIIPVLKISKPEESESVTDLSYFHVNCILKQIKRNPKLSDEIRLIKRFTHSQDCYGAESYIQGFSGYSLELLICHYKTFLNFIKEIAKLNIDEEKLVIDDAGFYRNKNQALLQMNKSKIYSPIILIDPTFKERNALSSLSIETLKKFQISCKKFLKNPSPKFFIKKSIYEEFKKYKNVKIVSVKTNKQPGDVAGTKSKKFFNFFMSRLKKEFTVKKSSFEYSEMNNIAFMYFLLDKKKLSLIKGPPKTSINNLVNFKKIHKNAFIKNGFAYTKIVHNLTFNEWFKKFLKKDKKIIREMGVKSVLLFKNQK